MLKLVTSEKLFLEAELAHIESLRSEGKAYQAAAEFRDEALSRIRRKRKNLLKSLAWILFLVLAGAFVALVANKYVVIPINCILALRTFSVFCIAWAVWSKLGDVETPKRETLLLEQTSQYIWKFFYSLGAFMGSTALFLVATSNA
jgi:hypothetical protein